MSISKRTMTSGEEFEVRHPLERPVLNTTIVGESRTLQSAHDETRIQNIFERFTRTGVDSFESRKAQAQFGDVSHLNKPLTELLVEAEATLSAAADLGQKVQSEIKTRKAKAAGASASSAPASAAEPVAQPTSLPGPTGSESAS